MDFEEFFRAEYERLFQTMRLVAADGGEAEDLAQEAMVRVYERWAKVRSVESPAGYLYQTAFNLNRRRLRRLRLSLRRTPRPPPPADPLRAVDERDEARRVLASLPLPQREALVLVEWLGMGSEEAGRILGIEATSVRVRVHRAKVNLRRRMERIDG